MGGPFSRESVMPWKQTRSQAKLFKPGSAFSPLVGGRTTLWPWVGDELSRTGRKGRRQTGPSLNQSVNNDLRPSAGALWGLLLHILITYMDPRKATLRI